MPIASPPKDPVERWITGLVAGRTFVDIGGIGVQSTNERVTFASRAGASRVTMADIRPFSYYEWTIFAEKCAKAGVTDVERIDQVDITSPDLANRMPVSDLVHCTGILYHVPDPVSTVRNLLTVVGRHLIVNTITVPARVENDEGALAFDGNVALFLPGTSERERRILDAHYRNRYGWTLDDIAPRLEGQPADTVKMPYLEDGRPSCWPYWWLMTDDCVRSLLRLFGLRIVEEWKWDNHCLFCLCERPEAAP
jgi:hypothetical protein